MRMAIIAAGLAVSVAACDTPEVERDPETGMTVDTMVGTDANRTDGTFGDTLADTAAWTAPDTMALPADSARLQRQPTP